MATIDRFGSKTSLPNPYRTYSNFIYPRTIEDVFIWAQWLWSRNAKYRTAIQKVVSYFISSLDISQDTDDTSNIDAAAIASFREALEKDYDIFPLILRTGEELAAMGNVFVSAERVFSRDLICPSCAWQMHLKNLRKHVEYEWDGTNFHGECPSCHKNVVYRVQDVKSQDTQGRRVRFVFRSAEDMRVQYNRLTETFKFFYKMPDDIAQGIRRGDVVYLEDSPKVFLEAASKRNQLVEFPSESFFTMRTRTLSSLDKLYMGWGLPLFMSSFDNLVRLQHLDKFNEAVITDYITPTRLLSPAPQTLTAGVADPNRMPMSGAQLRNFLQSSLKQVRNNPSSWIISPVPLQYQRVGGEAELAPVNLMEWYTSQILSDMGIPQEFRQTSLNAGVAPTMGLRMFERQWVHLAKSLSAFTKWAAKHIADAHSYENMTCELSQTSFVEDDSNRQVMLNLMQGQLIAKTNVLKRFGIDYEDEVKMKVKEAQLEEKIAREQQQDQQASEMVQSVMPPAAAPGIGQAQMNIEMMQQQAQAAAQGGAPPQGGGAPMPPQGGGGMPAMPFNTGNSQSATLEQLFAQAQEMAQQLYSAPPNVRRQELVNLKATNPSLHAQVKQIMADMSQQVASDAVAQARQGG